MKKIVSILSTIFLLSAILDYEFLTSVHKKEQAYVMYADSCVLSDSDLQRWNITFKKIPRDIEHI